VSEATTPDLVISIRQIGHKHVQTQFSDLRSPYEAQQRDLQESNAIELKPNYTSNSRSF
jgi:hypothetical protein